MIIVIEGCEQAPNMSGEKIHELATLVQEKDFSE